jgi:hypothetical protein
MKLQFASGYDMASDSAGQLSGNVADMNLRAM